MQELAIVLLVVAALALLQFLSVRLSPEALVKVVVWTLNIINVFIVVVNIIQARQRNKRVLRSLMLGHITLATGVLLFVSALATLGWNSYTAWISLPFVVSGLVTYLSTGIFIWRDKHH